MPKNPKNPFILLIAVMCFCFAIPAGAHVPKIIFDTDFAPDIDDVAALAMLHVLADNGEANILATMGSASHHWSPGAIDAINTYYGRPDIPIGGGHNSPRPFGLAYAKILANGDYGNDVKSLDDVPNSVSLYRKLLDGQTDDSITIVTVGFLTNLSDLIDTPVNYKGDGIMKTGLQLVREKVNLVVTMGGRYPSGWEYNFARDGDSEPYGVGPYTYNAITNWPTPIVFVGGEIGDDINTGPGLAETPADNPVRVAYESYLKPGTTRPSWDQTAVLYAVRGSSFQGTAYWSEVTQGFNEISNARGGNAWRSSPDKDHTYVVKSLPNSRMVEIIEGLMTQKPAGGWPGRSASDPGKVLLRYDFRDGSGTTVSDISGRGNHGMLIGFSDTSAGVGEFNFSEGWLSEGGISFLDGSIQDRSYVETPLPLSALYDSENGQNKSFTVEFVANWAGSSGWSPVIGSNHGCSFNRADAFYLGLHKSLQRIHMLAPGANSTTLGTDSNPWIASDSVKHHVAMTFDNRTERAELFVDGISIGSGSFAGINMNRKALFRIGNTGWSGTEQWGGNIYSFAITAELLNPTKFVLN